MQKMIKILVPLETRFLSYFEGFWVDFGGMLASKMESRSMLSSRGHFLIILELLGAIFAWKLVLDGLVGLREASRIFPIILQSFTKFFEF